MNNANGAGSTTPPTSNKRLIETVENYVEPQSPFTVVWGREKLGWGQLYFYVGEDRKVHCCNELMSKAFIKEVLNEMVDNMVLDDDVPYRSTNKDG